MAFFSKLKLNDLWKMRGYPQFSFRIPRALAKFCFLRIVLNTPVLVSTTNRKPQYLKEHELLSALGGIP